MFNSIEDGVEVDILIKTFGTLVLILFYFLLYVDS